MNEDMLPRIFDMFTQAHGRDRRSGRGLGIGLTLGEKLVELHGGIVEAQSAGPGTGTGSEFTLGLPFGGHARPQNVTLSYSDG